MVELQNPIDDAIVVPVPAGSFVMGSERFDVDRLWRDNDWDRRWFDGQVGGDDWVGATA